MGKREPPKLSDDARVYVVQAVACFDPPGVVAVAVKREFGLTITPQAVEAYDPTKRAGRKLVAKWRALFEETRRVFLTDTAKIGIANRAVRLRAIGRIAEQAETRGNVALALQAIEQAAKEVGDSYTNRREVTGAGGGPISTALVDAPPAETREQWLARKAQERAEAVGAGGG